MLILTRQIGESLIIGDDVKITVLPNFQSHNQVKLGIDAPGEISVYREEIYNVSQHEGDA